MQLYLPLFTLTLLSVAICIRAKNEGKADNERTSSEEKSKESTESGDNSEGESVKYNAKNGFRLSPIPFDHYPDPCLQPKPQESNSTNPNYWFFYNQKSRRCEVFPYDGHVVSRSSGRPGYPGMRGRNQNRFEFFQDCFRSCQKHMKLDELQVKNPVCLGQMSICKKACPEHLAPTYFTFENMECTAVKVCCPGGNAFSTMNECRKSCHYADENENGKESEEGMKPKCTGKVITCLIMCYGDDKRDIYVFNPKKGRCVKPDDCRCSSGEFFLTAEECEERCE